MDRDATIHQIVRHRNPARCRGGALSIGRTSAAITKEDAIHIL
jgi:hypothetical protein